MARRTAHFVLHADGGTLEVRLSSCPTVGETLIVFDAPFGRRLTDTYEGVKFRVTAITRLVKDGVELQTQIHAEEIGMVVLDWLESRAFGLR